MQTFGDIAKALNRPPVAELDRQDKGAYGS
jgi:hypothetical protein